MEFALWFILQLGEVGVIAVALVTITSDLPVVIGHFVSSCFNAVTAGSASGRGKSWIGFAGAGKAAGRLCLAGRYSAL
jgi:hypothetical protein